ncbi:hypothetical protein A2933_00120 [Candidatus Nomurabacteria bacterium RIFCSPLOWO2_01_FULL_46_18]|uniref:Thioredoxin-like fold domain-containing protein n=1 Tax=Candidatus Nomurabacteria bacterium RIFCSPLOWO2_01_FULL_46_18 TaxID=1801783 RepID=A0A1F6XDT2_9BACT|nr:MAG: hypothetical protein A2933_00120 [Candidatus Nomurabacteria bacterium RIFCSPLOWO2_01_FULL_46_18]
MIDWKKYLIVFLITATLFLSASYLSNYFGGKKIGELQLIQDKIAIDILSSETQYALLSDLSCRNVSGTLLSGELAELGKKLEWGEENLGDSEEVRNLKRYYSLLEIKDYLLAKKISERCRVKSAFILYFYTTLEKCKECEREGLVLTALRDKYPELRVYSFDYSTDLSAVQSMLNIFKIEDTKLPALVIEDEVLTGFHSLEELETRVQESFKLQETKPEETQKK